MKRPSHRTLYLVHSLVRNHPQPLFISKNHFKEQDPNVTRISPASHNRTWILLSKQMTYIWQMWGTKSYHINQTQPITYIRSKDHRKEKKGIRSWIMDPNNTQFYDEV